MDIDSALMLISFAGLAMGPFWAKWTTIVLSRWLQPGPIRVASVTLVSVAVMLFWHAGPWVVMAALHGLLKQNLTEPTLPLTAALVFGPGVALQVLHSLFFTRIPDPV
jgi:uncharacterized protein YhhL (DUF1145 family)